MPEAIEEILRFGFEALGRNTIWCGYYDGNLKSRRVQEKLGFTYHHTTEGIKVSQINDIRTGHVMLMTREAWETVKQKSIKTALERGIDEDL